MHPWLNAAVAPPAMASPRPLPAAPPYPEFTTTQLLEQVGLGTFAERVPTTVLYCVHMHRPAGQHGPEQQHSIPEQQRRIPVTCFVLLCLEMKW